MFLVFLETRTISVVFSLMKTCLCVRRNSLVFVKGKVIGAGGGVDESTSIILHANWLPWSA